MKVTSWAFKAVTPAAGVPTAKLTVAAVPTSPSTGGVTPPSVKNVSSFVLVVEPTKPVPAVNPQGIVKISSMYFSWNLITAALVKGPKYRVSFPEEPTPEAAS